jgi:hypothetical protein
MYAKVTFVEYTSWFCIYFVQTSVVLHRSQPWHWAISDDNPPGTDTEFAVVYGGAGFEHVTAALYSG